MKTKLKQLKAKQQKLQQKNKPYPFGLAAFWRGSSFGAPFFLCPAFLDLAPLLLEIRSAALEVMP
jgi:hypothetical protein